MRRAFAVLLWLAAAIPAAGQEPLTITAALNEAVSFNPELLAMRRGPAGQRSPQRAAEILAETRRALAELAIARNELALQEGLLPMVTDMAVSAARSGSSGSGGMARMGGGEFSKSGGGEMERHDSSAMAEEIARVAVARALAQEQVTLAELRLNAVLGRRLDAPIEALAMRDATEVPADAMEVALARDQALAAAPTERREIVEAGVRRRVLEALARVNGARERATIMTSTLLPQAQVGFDGARAAYGSGHATFLEMMDAHHRQLQARVEYVAIYADYERALVDLDIAMGEPPERIAQAIGATPTQGN